MKLSMCFIVMSSLCMFVVSCRNSEHVDDDIDIESISLIDLQIKWEGLWAEIENEQTSFGAGLSQMEIFNELLGGYSNQQLRWLVNEVADLSMSDNKFTLSLKRWLLLDSIESMDEDYIVFVLASCPVSNLPYAHTLWVLVESRGWRSLNLVFRSYNESTRPECQEQIVGMLRFAFPGVSLSMDRDDMFIAECEKWLEINASELKLSEGYGVPSSLSTIRDENRKIPDCILLVK